MVENRSSLLRKKIFASLLKSAGVLTDLVQNALGGGGVNKASFKEEFLKLSPGLEREKFLYNEVIKKGKPEKLTPVTVDGPNGIKITYYVMPDYVMIDDLRVPLAPATAQKVADYFGMHLPTDVMAKQIYNAADVKFRATPLSGSGYTDQEGKYHSPEEVVRNRISQSDAAIAYNDLTNKELEKMKDTGTLFAGHGKTVLSPLGGQTRDVSFGGWEGRDGKPIQDYTIAHRGGASTHSEYGLYTRLVGNNVTITTPDGKIIKTTMDQVLHDPTLHKSVTSQVGKQSY